VSSPVLHVVRFTRAALLPLCAVACAAPPAWLPLDPLAAAALPSEPQRAEPAWDRSPWEGVFRPAAALESVRRVPWRQDGRGYAARFDVGGRSVTWRVDVRDGFPLRLLSIEEGGARIAPCSNAFRAPLDAPRKPRRVELDDGRLRLEYDDGLEARFEALGMAVQIELNAPRKLGDEAFELSLGGLVAGTGTTDSATFQVYGCDDAGVARVALQRGGARFLSLRADPTLSNASSFHPRLPGSLGPENEVHYAQVLNYSLDTRGRVQPLKERIWVAYSDRVLDVLPALQRAPSPGRVASNRFYLSVHVPDFALVERGLRQLGANGVTDLAIWMHKWQRDGYDRGYPSAVFPPNPAWGGLAGLQALSATAREAGYSFGLHHNWMFNGERLPGASVLDSDSIPRGPGDGGEFLKPRVALSLVDRVEGEFHAALQTSGTFSDSLTTGMPPVDLDAREPGVGRYLPALDQLARVVAHLRAIHGAPISGEGSVGFGNLLWSGLVDAMNGYVGMLTAPADLSMLGRHADLAPDFNLFRLRPLSVRVGVGEPVRYLYPLGGESYEHHPEERDEWLAASTLLGNAGYHWWIPTGHVGDIARDWWATAESSRRLLDLAVEPRAVLYVDVESGQRGSLEEHLARGGSLKIGALRAKVEYSGGLNAWVNLSELPWALDAAEPGLGARSGIVLAPMGRLVVQADFEAGLLQRDGQRIEYARWNDAAYIDGRGEWIEQAGLATDGAVAVRRGAAGTLRVHPIREYRLSADKDLLARMVTTQRVRIDRAWFGGESGAAAAAGTRVSARVLGPLGSAAGRESELVLTETGLEIDVDALATAGGLALEVSIVR
jgi:hypothetical protein